MVYCSNCGAELKELKIFCPECRFRHKPGDIQRVMRKARRDGIGTPQPEEGRTREEPQEEAEVYDARMAGSHYVEETQNTGGRKVTILKEGCQFCSQNAETRCFFCLAPICNIHTDNMKIFVRNNPFGGAIKACPDCSSQMNGQTPSQQAAQKAGMFFNVKPYHTWRVIRG